jgi:hypothetical protein
MQPYTTPRLNTLFCVLRALYGRAPTHREVVIGFTRIYRRSPFSA